MGLSDVDIRNLDPASLRNLPDAAFRAAAKQLIELQQTDRKETNLLYYEPVSERAEAVHLSKAHTVGVGGGNGSSKTETVLAHLCILGTGMIPLHFYKDPEKYQRIREQMRGPLNIRIVVESLTTVLYPIILPKLRWNSWDGIDEPGGERGHWGWIPKRCLIGGSWDKSWSTGLRTLTFYHLNPDNHEEVLGESKIQFMSYDQDWSDFASGNFHLIMHDEPPNYAIWRENQARTMRVNGRMFMAMTFPDEPEINVDWIFDELYEPGQLDNPNKDPDKEWHTLWTIDNRHLDRESVMRQERQWGAEIAEVRLRGGTIRFANRVHPGFTDTTQTWCFECKKSQLVVDGKCVMGHADLTQYNHVIHRDWNMAWPVVWLLDPHPRKPHMFLWLGIDPNDDFHVLRCDELAKDPQAVSEYVSDIETSFGWNVVQRIIDPNMGRSPGGTQREITWQDEFRMAGLETDLADDSKVGRKRVDTWLEVDDNTRRPRLTFEPGKQTQLGVHQMKRYMWDDWKRGSDKDQKQTPKARYDDFPTLLKYAANAELSFGTAQHGHAIIRRPVRGRDPQNITRKPGSDRQRVIYTR